MIKWQTEFNLDKCVLHGEKTPNYIFAKMSYEQAVASQIRDLRIIIALKEHQNINSQWQVKKTV